MKKNNKRITHLIKSKDNPVNKMVIFGIIFIFVITSYSTANTQNPNKESPITDIGRSIVWDVTINFNEPGGAYDYAVFGEATDGHDGPPADAYDMVKPPAPMPSYIRAWLNDSLPFPYDKLWKDYRKYPDTDKIWNLSIQWVPSDYVSPTTITMVWSPIAINATEYLSITLCTSTGAPLKNMLLYSSYTFNCPANIPQDFKIICSMNQPPNTPTNPNPTNGSADVSVNADLSWTGGDPDGDTVTYDVYFGTSSFPPKVVSNQTGTTYNPGTMSYGTTYYWKIIAWDSHDATTSGPVWHFTTHINNPPNAPSNPNPSNGATGVSVNADLSWTGGDPDGDTVTYDVYFGTSSSPPKVVSNQSGLVYDPGTLSHNTMYYWKIVAWDSHGASAVGLVWHFTTLPNNPPYTPSNPFPANGATGVTVSVDLGWTGGDPDGDTVTYDVYFGTTSSPPKVSSNQSGTSYDPGTLGYNTLYYWKIVAWDPYGASAVGPVWHFKTATEPNRPPYAPSNPNPPDGSIDIPINTDLSWTGGDPDSGDFVTYDVYCGTVFPLTKIAGNQTGTTHAIDHLLYSAKYYWKIVAWDNHLASNASPIWSFNTIKDSTPPIVSITTPKKGYLYVNLGDIITRQIPILFTTFIVGKIEVTVTATDSQSGIKRVEFYIDDALKATDTTAPYTWIWVERGYFFPYALKVIAFDCVGNQKLVEMRVWKIF